MKNIEIEKIELTGRKFINKENKENILCAYDLNGVCSPDCAACNFYGSFQKASCNRVGDGFDIGALE